MFGFRLVGSAVSEPSGVALGVRRDNIVQPGVDTLLLAEKCEEVRVQDNEVIWIKGYLPGKEVPGKQTKLSKMLFRNLHALW